MFPPLVLIAFCVLMLFGCGTESPNEESPPVAVLEMDMQQTHASSPSLLFTWVSEVDIDSRGRVFLVDGYQGGITLLSPALELLQVVGRAGEGPGEFNQRKIRVLAGDSLAVYDSALDRITVFAPSDFSVARTSRPSLDHINATWYWSQGQGRSLAIVRRPFYAGEGSEQDVDRLDAVLASEHGVTDTVLTVPSVELLVWRSSGAVSISDHPFGTEPIIRALDSLRFVYAHTAEAHFRILGMTGDTLATGQIPVAPIDVSRSEFEAAAAELDDDMRDILQSGAPYRWPIIRALAVELGDDPRIWLGVRGSSEAEFWPLFVFDSIGRQIAVSRLPAGQNLRAVRDGVAIATSTDALGVPRVHRYRILQGG